jgi:predicted O-methyltransferase YrrM
MSGAGRDPAARVRQLLLSGDNTLKNRSGLVGMERARERFLAAREVACEAGLDDALAIIELRLTDLDRRIATERAARNG